ncbi:MAG: 50S ribosomal protein L25/general stress protein Ctc [Bacteroidetes bacterium]|nr:50S ribosomal protein L25/general stress protein Ctc [Bacteroidota bacterium]
MKTVSLSGVLRAHVGKKDAKSLRNEGRVPCALYGNNTEQVLFSIDAKAFKPVIHTPETYLIELNIDGKAHKAVLKEVQYHPVSDKVLHVDFYEVREDKPVLVSLPVVLKGTSPGVIRGGKLKLKMKRLNVKGLIANMPENITVDISKLNVGQAIKVKDLKTENVTIADNANNVIVEVKTARGVVIAAEEETQE